MEPCLVTGLPHHRTIAALDIEQSTTRTDPVKADLRDKMYGGLCKTPVITSLRIITWDVQKADDMPQQVIGNGFSSR
jgi:hypothetical protein